MPPGPSSNALPAGTERRFLSPSQAAEPQTELNRETTPLGESGSLGGSGVTQPWGGSLGSSVAQAPEQEGSVKGKRSLAKTTGLPILPPIRASSSEAGLV